MGQGELYRLAVDKGMAPVKDSAKKAKTLRSKSEISAKFGFSIGGEWPAGDKASAPAAMFGATISF